MSSCPLLNTIIMSVRRLQALIPLSSCLDSRSHYSACPKREGHEEVELGEEWLLAHFFYATEKPDRFARRPRAPTKRRAKKGEASR